MDIAQLLNEESGFKNLPQGDKEVIISRFGESLLKRIIFRIFQVLSEQDKKTLENLQGGNEEKVNNFLKERISNLEEIRNEESLSLMSDFKEFLKGTK